MTYGPTSNGHAGGRLRQRTPGLSCRREQRACLSPRDATEHPEVARTIPARLMLRCSSDRCEGPMNETLGTRGALRQPADVIIAVPPTSITLLDGRRATLRHAVPADQRILDGFCASLSGGSLDARRIATLHVGTVAQRHRLVEDANDHATILALPPGDAPVLGVATYRAI